MLNTLAINVSELTPSRWQPRQSFDADALRELALSISDQGLINPVLAFRVDGHYELIAGERRSRAVAATCLAGLFPQHGLADWCARLASVGLAGMGEEERKALDQEPGATIQATIYPAADLAALHLLAVTENLDRADLTPYEEALAYKGLLDEYHWTQRELASHVNKSQGYIAQRMSLLGLNEKAINALNTRVISLSHARAIAAVPEALQPAATDYVVHAIVREDSPATTRHVENQLRALAAFVDPARWEPNGEHIYKSQQRNRLAVIKMLISGPYAAERVAKNLDKLMAAKESYETKNLLTAQPLTIVSDRSWYTAIVNALGMQPVDAWQNHWLQAGKTCENCIFHDTHPAEAIPGLNAFCPAWRNSTHTTCENWIDANFGPVIIDCNDYEINDYLRKAAAYIDAPFAHTDNLAAYVDAYNAAVADHKARDAQRQQDKADGPRRAIAAFWEWQQTLPAEWLNHSQAHACIHCRHFEPLNGAAPCRFALNPIKPRYESWELPRAPIHSVLCSSTLMMLPRCEHFTLPSGVLPRIYQRHGFSVGRRPEGAPARSYFMQWFYAVKAGQSVTGWSNAIWRGPLAWLCGDAETYDFDKIVKYLLDQWDEIGDGGMATLLDEFICEVKICYHNNRASFELIDLRDGKHDEWAALRFENRHQEERSWPVGWLKPWEAK